MAENKPKQLQNEPTNSSEQQSLFDFAMRQRAMEFAIAAYGPHSKGTAIVRDAKQILEFLKGGFDDMPCEPPLHVSFDPDERTMTYHFKGSRLRQSQDQK